MGAQAQKSPAGHVKGWIKEFYEEPISNLDMSVSKKRRERVVVKTIFKYPKRCHMEDEVRLFPATPEGKDANQWFQITRKVILTESQENLDSPSSLA